MRQSSIQNNQSVILTRLFLLLPIAVFAVITFLTHLSRILDLRFDLFAMGAGFAAFITIIVWVLVFRSEIQDIEQRDTKALVAVLLLGLICASLASIYHKPDSDDAFYVSNAVHFLTFPREAMGNELHYIHTEGRPILSVITATSGAFEYAQSLLATLLNLEYLTVYHVITVAFVGFAIPLAIYLLLSHYATESSTALMATSLVVALLLLLGDTIYTFGSYSFTRLFQGKVVLIAAGLPLYSALSLDYLSKPTLRRWIYIAIAAMALSGLSSTTFFLLPMLALGLGLAYELSFPLRRQSLTNLITYGLALVYPLIYGLYASQSVSRIRSIASPLSYAYPSSFNENLQLFINPRLPATPGLMVFSVFLVALLVRGTTRRFLLLWVGLIVALFINPIVAPVWIKYVTSQYIYWRVFLLLPLSSLVGAVFISILDRFQARSPSLNIVVTVSSVIILLALNLIPGSTSIYRHHEGSFGFPRPKVDGEALKVASVIAEKAPEGAMLAPPEIAAVTVMLEGGHPQLHLSKRRPLYDLISWGRAERRAWASFFTEGEGYRDEYFRTIVEDNPRLRVIVINNEVVSEVRGFLTSHGFEQKEMIDTYAVFWKD